MENPVGGQTNISVRGDIMYKYLPESINEEINNYFQAQSYSSKKDLVYRNRNQIDEMLSDSGFVYVSDTGNVIHSKRYCGSSYGSPVHIEQAIKHGYCTLCKKCAVGSHVEYQMKQLQEGK